MWQDHSPTETARAVEARLHRGQADGHRRPDRSGQIGCGAGAGLPWYVENIATDFLSPYHRYTPGKPVNWLFDATKARLRADPSDTTVFVREPSLSDPTWLAAIRARLEAVVRGQSQYRPLFYNLADEAGIGDLAAVWDADVAPGVPGRMRAWLRTAISGPRGIEPAMGYPILPTGTP